MHCGCNLEREELHERWRSFLQCLFPCCTGKPVNDDSINLKSMEETMTEAQERTCWQKFISFFRCGNFLNVAGVPIIDLSDYADEPYAWDNADEKTPFKNTNNFPNRSAQGQGRGHSHQVAPFTEYVVGHVRYGEQLIFYDEGKVQVGFVVWTGYRTEQGHCFDKLLIVLEVEYNHSLATNGTFREQVVVGPNNHKHFIMVDYRDTRKVPDFENGDYCIVLDEDIALVNRQNFHGGFITEKTGDSYIFTPLNTNFRDDVDLRKNKYRAYRLRKAPIPECESVSDPVGPISDHHLERFVGRNKGIQGWHNSCYLDTILFSFFAFSDQFDDILFDDHENMDHNYYMVLNGLRHDIVYPLRACHFVSSEHISELRRLMALRIDRKFEGDNRDIPETMDALFRQLLQVGPFLSIGQSTKDQSYFDGSYTAECIAMNDEKFPTSELLLENAAVQMDFTFEKMPNCFILQLPRESERDGCVLPSYTLDLKNLLYRSVKKCHNCECNATLQFPYLIVRNRGLGGTFFCEECAKNLSLDFAMSKQLPEPDMTRLTDETEVEMHALICIEKSHYNCYVRCGDRWVFFDSMSDQETLEDPATHEPKTFNIPLVEEVPNFQRWIKEAHRTVRDKNSLNAFFSSLGPSNELEYERAQRIFRFPYCIIYRKSELWKR